VATLRSFFLPDLLALEPEDLAGVMVDLAPSVSNLAGFLVDTLVVRTASKLTAGKRS
jgi:hypothetical protein